MRWKSFFFSSLVVDVVERNRNGAALLLLWIRQGHGADATRERRGDENEEEMNKNSFKLLLCSGPAGNVAG